MILLAAAGYAAETWLGWKPGLGVGLLAGFVVAALIPASGACAVRPPPVEDAGLEDHAGP